MVKKMEVEQNCQNCDFEDYDKHCPEGICPGWRPDLNYRRMLEAARKEMDHE